MDIEIRDKIENFLKELDTEIDVICHVDIVNIDLDNPYSSICDMLEDSQAFDVEIIYYSRAMEYLMENDNSLQESLSIADEYGFSAGSLNSEILASLLASRNSRDDFAKLESDIEEFFEEIRNELEELEDEEE